LRLPSFGQHHRHAAKRWSAVVAILHRTVFDRDERGQGADQVELLRKADDPFSLPLLVFVTVV